MHTCPKCSGSKIDGPTYHRPAWGGEALLYVCLTCGQLEALIERGADAAYINTPFVPCAVFLEDGGVTEFVAADVPIVWCAHEDVDLGYDMETGKLVGVRINGNVTTREHFRNSGGR